MVCFDHTEIVFEQLYVYTYMYIKFFFYMQSVCINLIDVIDIDKRTIFLTMAWSRE